MQQQQQHNHMNLDIKIEETGALSRRLTVTVPASDVDRMAEVRFESLGKTAKIPGFRPGHVPMDVVRKRFGGQVYGELKEMLLQHSAQEALVKHDLRPAGYPEMEEAGVVLAGQPFTFKMKVDLFPEIEPKGLDKLKVEKDTAEPNENLVEGVLEKLRDTRKEFLKKEGKVAKEDRVLLNASGKLKGSDKPFPGGEMENQQVEMGQGMLIAGFEENLVGMKEGEEKTFEVSYPKEFHNKELAGQPVEFSVKVLRVETVKRPELDDKFAKSCGADDLAGLKKQIQEHLAKDLQAASEQRTKRRLFDALDTANQFEVPEGLVDMEFESIWKQNQQEMMARGIAVSPEDKDAQKEFRDLAARRVRLGLLLAEIGKREKIEVSEKDIDAEINTIASQFEGRSEEVKRFYADPNRRSQIAGPLYEKKVTEFLMAKATITDKKVDAQDLITELG